MTSTEPARRSLAKKAGVLVEDSGVEEAASNRNDRAEYMRNYQAMRRGLPSDFMKQRPSTEDMEKRHEDLFDIVVEMEPMTVRQVFYQATTRGIVEKSENGYFKVMRALVKMRRSGRLPFAWIVDNSREIHQLRTFASIGAALQDAVDCYRMDYWTNANERVQIWLEKDALASVVEPVVQEYDVPLVVARGFSSWSQLHEAAIEYIEAFDGPTYIYQFGDYDPSGETAAKTIESSLRELAPRSEIHFERIAVTPEQIKRYNLPTRPTKTSDNRGNDFGDTSCELDALTPETLRGLVQEIIERHLPPDRLAELKEQEATNLKRLTRMVKRLRS